MRFLLIYLFILLLSNTAYAQWFETQGQAYINNNDNKAARNKAIENALKNLTTLPALQFQVFSKLLMVYLPKTS